MLTISGIVMDNYLQEYSVIISDLDSELSGRNAKGEMLRDRIRVARKISVSFRPMKVNEMSTVLSAVKNMFFEVTYLDPESGNTKTGTFYVGDRTAPIMRYLMYEGQMQWLWDVMSFNLVER